MCECVQKGGGQLLHQHPGLFWTNKQTNNRFLECKHSTWFTVVTPPAAPERLRADPSVKQKHAIMVGPTHAGSGYALVIDLSPKVARHASCTGCAPRWGSKACRSVSPLPPRPRVMPSNRPTRRRGRTASAAMSMHVCSHWPPCRWRGPWPTLLCAAARCQHFNPRRHSESHWHPSPKNTPRCVPHEAADFP